MSNPFKGMTHTQIADRLTKDRKSLSIASGIDCTNLSEEQFLKVQKVVRERMRQIFYTDQVIKGDK